MNKQSIKPVVGLLLVLWLPLAAAAQSTPGWGWVKYFGQSVYGISGQNTMAGTGRDAAGNLYIAGSYTGTPTVGTTATTNLGESEAFLAKYDPNGNLVWMKAMHGAGADGIDRLFVEPSGRCTVSGSFGFGRVIGNLSFSEFGSSLVLPGPAQLNLPNYGTATQPSYNSVPLLAVVEPDGTLAWAITPSPSYGFNGRSLVRDSQGNIYQSGHSAGGFTLNGTVYAPIGQSDGILIKYTASGQAQWVRYVGTPGSRVEAPVVKTDQSGAVYWMVSHSGAISLGQTVVPSGVGSTLVKFSPTNQLRWVRNNLVRVNNTPTSAPLIGIDETNGTLYCAVLGASGSTISATGAGSPVVLPTTTNSYTQCIVQCDSAGQVSWVKPLIGMTYPAGNSLGYYATPQLIPVANGFTLLASTIRNGQTSFVGSPTIYNAAQGGFICVLNYSYASNQVLWTRIAGTDPTLSLNGTQVSQAVVDPIGNVYVAGIFDGPATFGATTLPSTNALPWLYLAKLDQTILPNKAAVAGKPWRVYPNPATSAVQLEGLPPRTTVRVLDALGRTARTTQAATLDLTGLAPGLYLLQATGTAEPYQPQRLLVE